MPGVPGSRRPASGSRCRTRARCIGWWAFAPACSTTCYRLSEHDLALGHRRYFDLESLSRLVQHGGLQVSTREGLFLKCLTTAQLRGLQLGPRVMAAFCEVAAGYPEIANAVYLEAQP